MAQFFLKTWCNMLSAFEPSCNEWQQQKVRQRSKDWQLPDAHGIFSRWTRWTLALRTCSQRHEYNFTGSSKHEFAHIPMAAIHINMSTGYL